MHLGTKELDAPIPKEPSRGEITGQKLTTILEQHQKWVQSQGQEGERANLPDADLRGADLPGANLQGAVLRKANLKGADLLLADFQGACLVQANLNEANLLGSEFREADLQGATLEGATGLLAGKLAGANLFEAVLPKPVSEFRERELVGRTFKSAHKLLAAVLLLCALMCLIVATTTDAQLLKNSASLPFPRLGDAIPMLGFYLFLPVLLFGSYLYFHFYLQRLWDGLAALPAVFPDGRTLDKSGPWLLMGLARRHLRWLREKPPAFSFLETGIAALLAYWIVPATLVLFWGRYLTRQDSHGTLLHILLVVAAVAAAIFVPGLLGRTLPAGRPQQQYSAKASRRASTYTRAAVPLGTGVILALFSIGTIYGVPHNRGAEPRGTVRKWAPNALWAVGYNPFVDITETDVSARPKDWTGRDEDLSLVKGARLNRLSLRYAEAYRAFLANAHLWESDLEGANLSEADLRGANLRQANLRSAILDRALITRANLQGAHLDKANLARAELRDADLSFASLAEASLADARLESAILYRANLRGASLLRLTLVKADLRETNLEDTQLTFADLSGADLSLAKLSGAELRDAQLAHALLMEADLQRVDLRGANLQGAVLRGADLSGANLEGADLRDARGVSAEQICSAMGRRGALLDESLQQQVVSRCGNIQ